MKERDFMRKNYISASYLQSEVKKILLSEKDHQLGVSVHPNSYLFNYQDHLELQFQAFEVLKTLDLQILKNIITYPKTVKTLLSFIKEMKLYGISIDELPKQSDVDKEIKESIKVLFPIITPAVELNHNDFIIPTGLQHSEYHYTKENHYDLSEAIKPSSLRYYYAQNKRQELEAMIQDIITKDLKSVYIVVPDVQESLALVESIMKRYGFTGNLENRQAHLVKQEFHNFFNFLYAPTQRNFIKALEQNVFHLKYPQDTLNYIKHYSLSFSANIPFDLCTHEDERSELVKIQKRITNDLLTLSSVYQATKKLNYNQKYEYVYHYLFDIYHGQMIAYKTYYETYYEFLKEDNHSLILEHILSFSSNTTLPKGWEITDYNSLALHHKDHVYLMGLNAQNFPNIGSRNGLIDESYLALIETYPSLQTRSNYELQNKRRIYGLGNSITFSYHIANYEGKAIESSFEINDFFNEQGIENPKAWPLNQIRYREKHKAKLNPDLAKQLFTDHNTLYGSVSSLQLYANNPIQYFMERGLGLKEADDISFNPMIYGTLNHEIIETKDNENFMEDAWNNLVWPRFSKSCPILKLIEDRNSKLMTSNIEFLKEAQDNTKLKVVEKEKKVVTDDIFKNVSLAGYVDRIDQSENYFAIIDYKSSIETISQAKLQQGTQLQLLTYASIIKAHDQNGKIPIAVLNYAFRNPNKIDDELQSYKQSSGIVDQSKIKAEELWKKEKRYKGWFFEDPTDTFSSADYWTGLTNDKDGGVILPKSVYDFDKVEALLQDRYDKLYDAIISGVLDIDDLDMEIEETPKLRKDLR